jgi:hypothetical protein
VAAMPNEEQEFIVGLTAIVESLEAMASELEARKAPARTSLQLVGSVEAETGSESDAP